MDKLQLMIEADRRGLLPPEKKAALDEAVRRGLVTMPAAPADPMWKQLGRQVGLTGRHGIEGVMGTLGTLAEPIRQGLNLVSPVRIPTGEEAGRSIADTIGLPSPQTPQERIVGEGAKLMAGGGTVLGGAQSLAKLPGVAGAVGNAMSAAPAQQIASAAGAGTAGAAVKESGGDAGDQFLASLTAGLVAPLAVSAGQSAASGITGVVRNAVSKPPTPLEVEFKINQALHNSGVSVADIPQAVRGQIQQDVQKALTVNNGKLDPEALRRLIDYRTTGATPTRASLTLDPVEVTQQKNLAKLGANSKDPAAQTLSRVENANNRTLIGNLNDLGANTGQDALAAGSAVMAPVQARLAAGTATQGRLYDLARGADGRAVPLDRTAFVNQVDDLLMQNNKGAFLPAEIRGLVNEISGGQINKAGQTFDVPFNVNTIDQLKTTLATAQRGAKDGNVKAAIGYVRQALDNTPMEGQQSEAAMKAFDRARRFSKALYDFQESSPAIKAIVDGVEPDKFVRNFIIADSNQNSVANVGKLGALISKSPEAKTAVRGQITAFLKDKALSGSADEVGNFSQSAYNNALKMIGERKLAQFFDPDEIAKLQAVGRVASYEQVQPKGSAVNNSNTAGTGIATLLDRIADAPILSKLPFGRAAIGDPVQNIVVGMKAKEALSPTKALALPTPATPSNAKRIAAQSAALSALLAGSSEQ